MSQPVNFSKYLCAAEWQINKLNKIGQENLLQGVNYIYQNKTYNIRMFEENQNDGQETLFFRMNSNSDLATFCHKPSNLMKTSVTDDKREKPENLFEILNFGTFINNTDQVMFEGELSKEETAFYKEHPELKPRMTWTRNQKAGAVLIALLAAATLGFGAKKLMNAKSWNPMNWGKVPEAPTPVQMPQAARSTRRR